MKFASNAVSSQGHCTLYLSLSLSVSNLVFSPFPFSLSLSLFLYPSLFLQYLCKFSAAISHFPFFIAPLPSFPSPCKSYSSFVASIITPPPAKKYALKVNVLLFLAFLLLSCDHFCAGMIPLLVLGHTITHTKCAFYTNRQMQYSS